MSLTTTHKSGFTLIEILVSVAIFSVVMVIALGALLAISVSDRKAQTLKSVINNLNFSIDSMSRAIRTGTNYHCNITSGTLTSPLDCSSGGTSITFLSANNVQTYYRLNSGSNCANGTSCIERMVEGGSWQAITAQEVYIDNLSFFVIGSYPHPDSCSGCVTTDRYQPRVTLLISGHVQVNARLTTSFDLQTTVTQRLYDQ